MTYSDEVLADSPFLYWRLGESAGTTAEDATANNRDGTYENTPTLGATGLLTGDADTAVTLASASSQAIARSVQGVTNGSEYTLECWVKAGIQSTFAKLINEACGPDLSGCSVEVSSDNGTDGLYYYVRNSVPSDVNDILTAKVGIFDNTRHHVVITDKDIAGTRNWALFVDGDQRNSGTYTRGTFGTGLDYITAGRRNNGVAGDSYLNGTIDEVALYSTALTSARIRRHFEVGANVVKYRMVQGAGHVRAGN